MSSPKLSMRRVRRHPAVISKYQDLEPGMEVAVCYLFPPIKTRTRCAQALYGFSFPSEKANSRREGLIEGFKYTPTWGLLVDKVATINWINDTNPYYEHPYVSLRVTQSGGDLSAPESRSYVVPSMATIGAAIEELPRVNAIKYDHDTETVIHEQEYIVGIDHLGLAPDPYSYPKFTIDLAKLDSYSAKASQ